MERSKHVHERLYRALLLLYPRSFRTRFGSEMVEVFRGRLSTERMRHPRTGALRSWIRIILDLLRSAPNERWEEWMARTTAVTMGFVALGYAAISIVTGTLSIGGAVIAALVVGGLRWVSRSAQADIARNRLRSLGLGSLLLGAIELPFTWWSGEPELLLLIGATMLLASNSRVPARLTTD